MLRVVAAQFGPEHGEGVAMQGPAGVSRGWEAARVAIAVIAVGFFAPAQSQGVDVALLLQQTPFDGGIITPSRGVHFFALNSEIVLTAIPNPGYKFIYWLGDVGNPTANRTITYLNKPKIIIAVFEPVEYDSSFMGRGSVGGGQVTSGGLIAAADYGGWGQTRLASSGSRPSESQAPNLYQQVVEPLPPIPEPATGILLLLGSLFLIARKRNRAVILLLFILCLAPSAYAGLFISVNGVIEPPLAEVKFQPSETAVIGIHSDGRTASPMAAYLLVKGPGSIDGHTMVYPVSLAAYEDLEAMADSLGRSPEDTLVLARDLTGKPDIQDLSFITLADPAIPPAPLDGLLVDDITFHCRGFGDVTLTLISDDYVGDYPTQIIHQVPKPVTLLLLGLGGVGVFRIRRQNQ